MQVSSLVSDFKHKKCAIAFHFLSQYLFRVIIFSLGRLQGISKITHVQVSGSEFIVLMVVLSPQDLGFKTWSMSKLKYLYGKGCQESGPIIKNLETCFFNYPSELKEGAACSC